MISDTSAIPVSVAKEDYFTDLHRRTSATIQKHTELFKRTFRIEEKTCALLRLTNRAFQIPGACTNKLSTVIHQLAMRTVFLLGLGERIYHVKTANCLFENRFRAAYASSSKTHAQLERMWCGLPKSVQSKVPKPPYFGHNVKTQLYKEHGAHITDEGTHFLVRAPKAQTVALVLFDKDGRECNLLPMTREEDGSWRCQAEDIGHGQRYMYRILGQDNIMRDKVDPFGTAIAARPSLDEAPQSIVQDSKSYEWTDRTWLDKRVENSSKPQAMSIYELHVGAWKSQNGKCLNAKELAKQLTDYCADMGYTHVELMGLLDHPFEGSWGYQVTSFFAPNHRLGGLDDIKYLVDTLHSRGIGVIADWVPAHFATDDFGLKDFDGSKQYEQNWIQDKLSPAQLYCRWGTKWFNYSDKYVRDFLISGAHYLLDELHIDGLRVDAMAAVLERNNPSASKLFLRDFNHSVHERFPGVLTVAEDFTGDPKMTRPIEEGGFGFDYKWHTGWMYFTLNYFHRKMSSRQKHYSDLQKASRCDEGQKAILALSHDEVANAKSTLLHKTQGLETEAERLANLRLLLSYQWMLPGKKLTFMGEDRGASEEWSNRFIHNQGLDWDEQQAPDRQKLATMVRRLNKLYKETPALHDQDEYSSQMRWLLQNDPVNQVIGYYRTGDNGQNLACLHNSSKEDFQQFTIEIPKGERRSIQGLRELFNSDSEAFGGEGRVNHQISFVRDHNGHIVAFRVHLPPLSTVVLEET